MSTVEVEKRERAFGEGPRVRGSAGCNAPGVISAADRHSEGGPLLGDLLYTQHKFRIGPEHDTPVAALSRQILAHGSEIKHEARSTPRQRRVAQTRPQMLYKPALSEAPQKQGRRRT